MQKPNLELLDKEKHKSLKIDTSNMDLEINRANAAFVVVNELSTICHEYPVFISKNPRTGQFQLTAVLGFESGQNLYLQNGKWDATYLPLDILRRPFQAMVDDEDTSSGRIALDVDSEMVRTQRGQALFDENGDASPYLQRIQQTFSQLMAGANRSQEILKQADEMELLEQVTVSMDKKDGEKVTLNGLYAFKQEAIAELTGEALEKAHKSGILQVCHLVLCSGVHLQKLVNWADQLDQ
ncbi:SapC family protein [Gayadomonas joobiniege]|uniref:SapC family protein n=1 Tax=Gayadomonas joobiniege TaxID=1234606 RepID=UPI00037EC681|nr:SapC family protein [Gayadomonas joobiniege]